MCRPDPLRLIHPGAAVGVDVELVAVDVAAVVYIHHGEFRRRHLLAEARRHLARELAGRRAGPGLDDRIVDAAIGAYCVDVTPPPVRGRPPRPGEYTVYTAAWHPGLQPAQASAGGAGGDELPGPAPVYGLSGLPDAEVPELTLHERAVATSIRLQALVRAGRAAARTGRPARSARARKPTAADQAAATALYGQMSIDDVQEDREPGLELSPEQLAKVEQWARDAADRAGGAPKARKRKGRPGPGGQPPRPGYRPRR